MSEPTTQHQVVEDVLDRVVTTYLKRRDQGEQPDRRLILAEYPLLAGPLQEFFANQDAIELRTAGLRHLQEFFANQDAIDQRAAAPRQLQTCDAERGEQPVARSMEMLPCVEDYQIEREIARGGMGVVYRARQVSLNRIVALKMVLAGELAGQKEKQRFQAEAEAAAGLEHPNIVPIYQVGSHHAQPFLTMKLIDGPPLSNAIAGLSDKPRVIAQLVARIARAVHFAHQRGILHRDLKPGNVLLDSEGMPHVTDFGLAKKVEGDASLTQSGAIVGTPSYMAPEQAAARKGLTTAVDVYGLGAILYECLTGQPPFRAASTLDTLLQVLDREPERPRTLNPRIDRDLETVCLKCLQKDPTRRYGSAEALAEDLERWLAGEPIVARPTSRFERSLKWMRRRPAAAALLAVSMVAALSLVGSVVGLTYSTRLQDALHRAVEAGEGEAEARKQAEMYQYFHHVGQAQMEWRQNSMGRMESLLDNCPNHWRNWEWNYLKRLGSAELLTIKGHQGAVLGVAYSPDGTRFASAGADKTVRIWDAATGNALFTLGGHTDSVLSVAFSPDGKWLASAGGDNTVRVWETANGRAHFTLKGHKDKFYSVAFSPDGTQIASVGADNTVWLWDVTNGKHALTIKGHKAKIFSVVFSPDGRCLAAASAAETVKVWNVRNGSDLFFLEGHMGAVNSVAFSPDGSRLATASADQKVRLWDATSGKALNSINIMSGGTVVFGPDGVLLASAGADGIIEIGDINKPGILVQSLQGHKGSVNSISFSPDGSQLLSASADGTIKVWAVRARPQSHRFAGHTKEILSLSFSPDGTHLASASLDETVRVWNVTTGQESLAIQGHTDGVYGVSYSPDGSRLASAGADETVRVWNTTTGGVLQTYLGHKGPVFCVTFAHDGARLASASGDQTVKLWDMTTAQEVLSLQGHTGSVHSVVFSPDDKHLVTASRDKTSRVWDATTGKNLLSFDGHFRPLHCAVFSPDGQRIASGNRGLPFSITTTRAPAQKVVIDEDIDEVMFQQVPPPGRVPPNVIFTNKPTVGFNEQSEPGKVIIWDAATGQEILVLRGHTGLLSSVAFNPDGTRLASASDDRTVRVWDVTTGESLLTLQGHTGSVNSIAFSPDGTRLASASDDRSIRIWDARPLTPEVAVERESVALLEFLFSRPLCKTDVIEYLNNSPTIRPETRQKALALAKHYREQNDPEVYHQASRALSRQPYLNVFQYRFALRQAETACRLAPGSGKHLTALGSVQYRLGQYQAALATLTRADRLNKDSAIDLAFTAMALYRLGQKETLQSTVDRLRAAMKRPEWAKDSEARDSMREAEAMIPGMKAESRK